MIYVSAQFVTPPPYTDESMVQGWDADGANEIVPYNHTVFRLPEHGPLGFVANGGVIAAYVAPPEPPPTVPCEVCGGTGRVEIEE